MSSYNQAVGARGSQDPSTEEPVTPTQDQNTIQGNVLTVHFATLPHPNHPALPSPDVYSYWSDDSDDEDEIDSGYRTPLGYGDFDSDTESIHDSDSDSGGCESTFPLKCNICGSAATIQFRTCTHAACRGCTKKLWWGRVKSGRPWPTWFPCPWCRAEVCEVGVLWSQALQSWVGDKRVHEGVEFTVWRWWGVKEWMVAKSRGAALRMRRGEILRVVKAVAGN